ncbi:leucine-rich repeat extensin-like protein 1 [Impatiens glandulifera]|uniref:leucine-rich repeat extensin-like protein 1 n=1 Tax=Impatiens glandulifera TaxID=253017 RepID=UPI001FB14883|nr:leucine-rich repeat extensin-like protein 1 [Impatiens glandulifera]
MAKSQLIIHLSFLLFISTFIPPTTSSSTGKPAPANSWIGSKYQIECTMCSACDDPCNPPAVIYSPPPPPPSPSPPPPSNPSLNCPPPPSPPSSGGYYYSSPPPPYQQTFKYYPPPPFGNYYYYPPPMSGYYPHPPPPNPIVPYFPFYFHNPPLPLSNVDGSVQLQICLIHYVIALFVGFLLVY